MLILWSSKGYNFRGKILKLFRVQVTVMVYWSICDFLKTEEIGAPFMDFGGLQKFKLCFPFYYQHVISIREIISITLTMAKRTDLVDMDSRSQPLVLRPSTGAGLSTKSVLLAMVSVIAMISQMLITCWYIGIALVIVMGSCICHLVSCFFYCQQAGIQSAILGLWNISGISPRRKAFHFSQTGIQTEN